LAPLAARHAATTGDHREAARLYALAFDGAGATLDDAAQARLLEAWAGELTLINRHREAIAAREQALAIHRQRGDRLREGINLRWLARLHWFDRGGQTTSVELAQQAIDTLQALPASRELALAYSTLSHLCLVREDMAGAQAWGLRAIELAEATDDAEAMTHALNNVGTAMLRQRDDALAWNRLARSLELALEHGLAVDAARAYNNLFILCVIHHDFAQGLGYAEQGIAHCEAHGLDVFSVRILIRRAFARIVMGQWALAAADLDQVAHRHAPSPMEASTHAFVASVLALRQGQGDAVQRLRDSIAAMHAHRVEIWFITTAAAQAEAAWLEGDAAALEAVARPALAAMLRIGDRWRAGELAAWLRRAGRPVDAGALLDGPAPYAHELAGRWQDAAAAWQRLCCPYDQALALCSGDDAALAEALVLFDALGARAAAERVRALLRERGVRGVPRGPQPRTRDDPLNLTARERQVFELLCRGLSNAAIAAELRRSERTVEHHVSALLRKCGVSTRVELLARHAAAERGGP
jgi:DNA-binding CsgD family transcriptional regulator